MMRTAPFRLVLSVCAFALLGTPGIAERFFGRKVDITDGRSDPGKPAPVVVAMHGFLGTSRNMRQKTRFDVLARRHGFIVVYPNGKRRKWNDGRNPRNRVDDVGFLTSLIAGLVADGRADPARVFLTGHSNGGGMAMRMACERPEMVAGISVVATKVPVNFQCANGRPVPALFVHGTDDPISPHQGRPADSRLGAALSSEASLNLWQRRNRCRGVANTRVVDRKDDGTSVKFIRYARCAAQLSYVVIDGHGHDWPNPNDSATRLQGPATKELNATALTWQFFERQN